MATRAEDLAEAYLAVARVNHYMVGIVGDISQEDRELARAILIDNERDAEFSRSIFSNDRQKVTKLALDLLEQDERNATIRASQGR